MAGSGPVEIAQRLVVAAERQQQLRPVAQRIAVARDEREGTVEITKRLEDEGVDVDGQVISITLTQADTLLLGSLDPETDQTVEVQIRGKTADGRAFASNFMTAPVSRILKDGQI